MIKYSNLNLINLKNRKAFKLYRKINYNKKIS